VIDDGDLDQAGSDIEPYGSLFAAKKRHRALGDE
jgi:hypothetical protein